MPQYAALIEYDGTAYYGFQRQKADQPTIQSKLEEALYQIIQQPVTITGAGRTDAGVHALGQVVGFTIEWRHGVMALRNALNVHLPDDIAVLQLKEAPVSFHPRFDAKRRAYQYVVLNAPTRRPMARLTSWQVARPLQIDQMNAAAAALHGEHNFATFGQPSKGDNCVRHVFAAWWQRQGEFLLFFIEANAFLYRMVRSLVGSLKLVGDGTWTVDDFVAALQSQDRAMAGPTAPAQGLFLVYVAYDDLRFEIGDRQSQISEPFLGEICNENNDYQTG
ncbi:MAG: tRNA pseudouridine(38-40) synthase TruA [Chloroflexi bacterium]|nr:tRNA pseudouridine(38-40) synthase TruA [Ardenticatenaceae bacterium]MBL1130303.1 tRNA pseudouridine(38-40) synthase TruA [Chloroflexota bacterium]NOG36395.1 tRNA pseudouridine(38-40) synthase TruA [Chloroflexota bacterium]GIK57276.1 MAG: tRNA pseudouridine synthase A [Chloroflexota bacterium]